jgi:hypothetical protein
MLSPRCSSSPRSCWRSPMSASRGTRSRPSSTGLRGSRSCSSSSSCSPSSRTAAAGCASTPSRWLPSSSPRPSCRRALPQPGSGASCDSCAAAPRPSRAAPLHSRRPALCRAPRLRHRAVLRNRVRHRRAGADRLGWSLVGRDHDDDGRLRRHLPGDGPGTNHRHGGHGGRHRVRLHPHRRGRPALRQPCGYVRRARRSSARSRRPRTRCCASCATSPRG